MFETVLVVDGRVVEREGHLERLAESLAELFGLEPPAGFEEDLDAEASGMGLGRVRLAVAPKEAGLTVDITSLPVDPALVLPTWERAVDLVPLSIPGGLGRHKWIDRLAVSRSEIDAGPGGIPLLVDGDEVLEASRGNVFFVRDGVLRTAPLDGRILPGITRERVLEIASSLGLACRTDTILLADLVAADEVFVTGSVRGVEPARSLREIGEWREGAVTRRLSSAVRRNWALDTAVGRTR